MSDVELSWPEGRLLLVVDPNEAGKTTLCEAVVAALYGLRRGRAGSPRPRDLRRPRSGAALSLGLDVELEGARLAVDRDLESGTLRVLDRKGDRDVTRDYQKGSARDDFGEKATGLTEALFRTTAFVGQNVLDRDLLDVALTPELARIADAGGGDASVVRALRLLEAARAKMPEAATGGSVTIDTEVQRATRKHEERAREVAALSRARAGVAEAVEALHRVLSRESELESRRHLEELSVVKAERDSVARRLVLLEEATRRRDALDAEARSLAEDDARFSSGVLFEIDALLDQRGHRPAALQEWRSALDAERTKLLEDAAARTVRSGVLGRLAGEERTALRSALASAQENARESAVAEEEWTARWEELRREGLAEDWKRLEALSPEDREFLSDAEEERQALELQGVRLDRRSADAAAQANIAAGERRLRTRGGQRLLVVGMVAVGLSGLLFLAGERAPRIGVTALAFSLGLALWGVLEWTRSQRYRQADEARLRDEDTTCRREAAAIRRRLSDLRLRLDRASRAAGFANPTALVKAQRRARAAEAQRQALLRAAAKRDSLKERRKSLEKEIEPFRTVLELEGQTGLPSVAEASRLLALLEDVEKAERATANRLSALELQEERFRREEIALLELDRRLGETLEKVGIPRRLGLPEALLDVDVGRRRAARRREILDVELPARAEAVSAAEVEDLRARLAGLETELKIRRREEGIGEEQVPKAATPEEARRAVETTLMACAAAKEARAAAEKKVAISKRAALEKAREILEAEADAEAVRKRAEIFRDAVDMARERLQEAASSTYGGFRRGLQEMSRGILSEWGLPYEALEFGDDLSLSAIAKGGRVVPASELSAALSTGTREQLHLTARLCALRYLGSSVPLLLDDPLVAADDVRFAAVMRFLIRHVLEDRPVLLVSCHGWRYERLLSTLEPELKRRVAKVSLRKQPRRASRASAASRELPTDGAVD